MKPGILFLALALVGCDARPKPEPKPARQRLERTNGYFAWNRLPEVGSGFYFHLPQVSLKNLSMTR
jgi:hypothetical protein